MAHSPRNERDANNQPMVICTSCGEEVTREQCENEEPCPEADYVAPVTDQEVSG